MWNFRTMMLLWHKTVRIWVNGNMKQNEKTNKKETIKQNAIILCGSTIFPTFMGEDDQEASTVMKITSYNEFYRNRKEISLKKNLLLKSCKYISHSKAWVETPKYPYNDSGLRLVGPRSGKKNQVITVWIPINPTQKHGLKPQNTPTTI